MDLINGYASSGDESNSETSDVPAIVVPTVAALQKKPTVFERMMASARTPQTKNPLLSNEPNRPSEMQTDTRNQDVERGTNIDHNDSEASEVSSEDEMGSAAEPALAAHERKRLRIV